MIHGIPKISVLIISYNQEAVISRTIESLLSQKDFLYEICVSDDCSTDKTWEILQEYSLRFPGLFVLNRNDPNVGIFENIEKSWSMPTGDMIYQLAGDDECGEGWFELIINYILNNHIDYTSTSFCIYGDYLTRYPNGDSFVFRNNLVLSPINVFRLSLRGLVLDRGCCYSKNVLNKFIQVSQGRSHRVEIAQDRQRQLCSDFNYYIPFISNIYYANIGVSSNRSEEQKQDRLLIGPFTKFFFNSLGIKILNRDIWFLNLYESRLRFSYYPSLYNFLRIIPYFFLSIDIKMILYSLKNNIRRRIFIIRRKVPHRFIIKM